MARKRGLTALLSKEVIRAELVARSHASPADPTPIKNHAQAPTRPGLNPIKVIQKQMVLGVISG